MSARKEALAALERADEETRERLLEADAKRAEIRGLLEAADAKLAEEIARASEEGWTQVRIGETLGISRQRVAQLRDGK
jgi:DNA-directed RNA polymerase specialized sigma24 family protein